LYLADLGAFHLSNSRPQSSPTNRPQSFLSKKIAHNPFPLQIAHILHLEEEAMSVGADSREEEEMGDLGEGIPGIVSFLFNAQREEEKK
jgi:hypothetical protein